MYRSFSELQEHMARRAEPLRVGVASPEDEVVLGAVLMAADARLIVPVLVGDARRICAMLAELGREATDYAIVDLPDSRETGRYVAAKVASGEFQAPMKGHMHTAHFLRPLLDKTLGLLPEKGYVNQITLYEETLRSRMRLICDCAVNIAPDLMQKASIIINAVKMAQALGCDTPKVAVIAPLETVNPDIPSTMEAALLAKMGERGAFGKALVDGPLSLDLAVSPEAAALKGVGGPVAGQADILVTPDLDAGNIAHKTLVHIAGLKTSGIVLGARVPIIMTSRTDSMEDKFRSILTAMATAGQS
jgi:phosphate butyryltransferase